MVILVFGGLLLLIAQGPFFELDRHWRDPGSKAAVGETGSNRFVRVGYAP
jgi:hypothetical protein